MGKNNGALVQIRDVYSSVDDSSYRRQKVYKNHVFPKVVLILACDTTNDADETMKYVTTSKEDATTLNLFTKKTQQHQKRKDWWKQRKYGFLCDSSII